MNKTFALVPAPNPKDHSRISPWVDEQIWGHRLWDGQTPWLLFLEFLSVAEACSRQDQLLDENGVYYPLVYNPYKRMYLRNILFNNVELARIADQQGLNNDAAWDSWIGWMNDNAQGIAIRDFSYLKRNFHSFRDFADLVAMLQNTAVEAETNRRWVSRFVFPFGPEGLYIDLGITDGMKTQPQYINFGRTGELLYLMLCRSAQRDALVEPVSQLFRGDNSWNVLLAQLQTNAEHDLIEQGRGHSYLPYVRHASFDVLGDDWLHVFRLGLPGFDAIPHLVTLGAFHVMLYQITVAADWLGQNHNPYMICEVVAPHKTQVRELSFTCYQENTALPARAVDAYLTEIEHSDEWCKALEQPDAFEACKRILTDRVWWPQKPGDYSGKPNPHNLMAELREEAADGHEKHVAQVHRSYGRDVGLISKRGTNKLRYAPNDSFLKTLIAANIETRMELHEFLERLYQRYGLVFGEREAALALQKEEFDKEAFRANAQRLEQRLTSLGLLRRLSDSCAYVVNPNKRRSV
ncbi:MAG TPA: hypothetical protein VKT82_17035 [Ktedonobacterales bacterium]|nr:hypothetical protein [Ktedonobacterales bacterium]